MRQRCCSILFLFLILCCVCPGKTPVIFDTDMGNDVDDALALAMLHALTTRGECQLIGVTLTNANPAAVPYVRLVNRFYGRGALPVGAATRTVEGGAMDTYLSAVLKTAPASYGDGGPQQNNAEPSVALLRRLLASSSEKVTIVQVGFSTNLAALLDSPADAISPKSGMELVWEKVALLSAMAGDFSGGKPEYNVKLDAGAAHTVFERWPTPVVFSGFEIGRELLYPAESIRNDFAYTDWHPVAASYRAYGKMPYNRPTWDLTAVLEAVRGNRGYFSRSAQGTVRVDKDGATRFEAGDGNRSYLLLNESQRARVIEAVTLLASEPPVR